MNVVYTLFHYPWPTWNKIMWGAIFALFLAFETLGLFDRSEATLTGLICSTVPGYIRAMLIGWLAYHFLIQHPV